MMQVLDLMKKIQVLSLFFTSTVKESSESTNHYAGAFRISLDQGGKRSIFLPAVDLISDHLSGTCTAISVCPEAYGGMIDSPAAAGRPAE